MSFDPNKHITLIKGKQYLEAKWRIVWFRDEHNDWGIETAILEHEKGKYAVVKAVIRNPEGREIGHGTKMEDVQGFADYLEKAETGAISRALAMCGYGTQFAQEFEEGTDVADSPVSPPAKQQGQRPRMQVSATQAQALAEAVAKGGGDVASAPFQGWLSKNTANGATTLPEVLAEDFDGVLAKLNALAEKRKAAAQ